MTDESRALAIEGVRFFGEMTASVSHEIKNVLAIINENAGLLKDMVEMSTRGAPLSPERLEGLAQSISRQVVRGDRVVKKMNGFAHSADQPLETVDVSETVASVASLADRLIAMQGQPPRIDVPEAPVRVTTNRFFLENIIWACLCRSIQACDLDQAITVCAEKSDETVRIRFQGLAAAKFPGQEAAFPSAREAMVCRMLNAQVSVDDNKEAITLMLVAHPPGISD